MKKILIIQTDPTYFLEESLRTIETYQDLFVENELSILVDKFSYNNIPQESLPPLRNILINEEDVISKSFDVSINLATSTESFILQGKIKSPIKSGTQQIGDTIEHSDSWALFLYTLKGNPPFLSFHLKDIYRNILGFRGSLSQVKRNTKQFKKLIIGRFNSDFINDPLKQILTLEVRKKLEIPELISEDEIDYVDDHSSSLFLGPPCLNALRISALGGKIILLTKNFEGSNLIPYEEGNYLITSNHQEFEIAKLTNLIIDLIQFDNPQQSYSYSSYKTTHEHLHISFLKALGNPTGSYPFYQIHTILWIYILNLIDLNLKKFNFEQSTQEIIKNYISIIPSLTKIIDAEIKASEEIFLESKKEVSSQKIIDENLAKINEIELLIYKTANKLIYLRQFLDFYKIKRSLREEVKLSENAQSNIIQLLEEQNVYQAYYELLLCMNSNNEARL